MRIDVFTIFPGAIEQFCSESLVGRSRREGLVDLRVHDLRQWSDDPRRSVDDAPFGGGAGMVLAPGPVFAAVEAADPVRPLYLLAPAGECFDQAMAERLATTGRAGGVGVAGAGPPEGGDPGFSLICGRYEGVDERIAEHLVDGSISVGDFVLAGGEVAALVVIEAVVRLVPGVMGNAESAREESFVSGLLEYPHYTRPASFRGWDVPEILLSGNHPEVDAWRRAQSITRTLRLRPDLIERRGGLSDEEVRLLGRFGLSGGDPVPG